jgi:hypothetical protein
MLFLDVCRDLPIGAKGTLVVYATESGKVAEDNTLFINELTKTIL